MPAEPIQPDQLGGEQRCRANLAAYLDSLPVNELGELPEPTFAAPAAADTHDRGRCHMDTARAAPAGRRTAGSVRRDRTTTLRRPGSSRERADWRRTMGTPSGSSGAAAQRWPTRPPCPPSHRCPVRFRPAG